MHFYTDLSTADASTHTTHKYRVLSAWYSALSIIRTKNSYITINIATLYIYPESLELGSRLASKPPRGSLSHL